MPERARRFQLDDLHNVSNSGNYLLKADNEKEVLRVENYSTLLKKSTT